MKKDPWYRYIHEFFDLSIILKGLNGCIEVLAGIILLFLSPEKLGWLVYLLTKDELSQDPDSFFANALIKAATHFTPHGKLVSVIFLLSHGLVKIFLVWNLFKGRLWAYPLTIGVLIFFILSQTAELFHSFSILLLGLTILDGIIVALAWFEYGHKKQLLLTSKGHTTEKLKEVL